MSKSASKKPSTQPLSPSEQLLSILDKKYGAGSAFMNASRPLQFPRMSSGSLAIDVATGGGYGLGRIVEIYGEEATGKTSLALHAVKEAQALAKDPTHPFYNRVAAIIDVEHALDLKYAEALGVDVSTLLISQPTTGEDALNMARDVISSGFASLVVVDSVAALVPKSELTGEIGDSSIGTQARLMSQAMRLMVSAVSDKSSVCIFINQLRSKVGVIFGNPEVTSGGLALKYYASTRLKIQATSVKTKDADGNRDSNGIKVTVVKNKLAPPHRVVESRIQYGLGIDVIGEVIDLSLGLGLITTRGSWYQYDDTAIGQGKASAAAFLTQNSDILSLLKSKIRIHYGLDSAIDNDVAAEIKPNNEVIDGE